MVIYIYIYIFLYLFVRSLTPLCFRYVHCGWIFFTNCSLSGLDTTQVYSTASVNMQITFRSKHYFMYHWSLRDELSHFRGTGLVLWWIGKWTTIITAMKYERAGKMLNVMGYGEWKKIYQKWFRGWVDDGENWDMRIYRFKLMLYSIQSSAGP